MRADWAAEAGILKWTAMIDDGDDDAAAVAQAVRQPQHDALKIAPRRVRNARSAEMETFSSRCFMFDEQQQL